MDTALVEDEIPTSAKFLSPVVWSKRFTGFTWSSHKIGLLTV